jgi:outer membrane lipoprotein-sorting protein
MKKSWIRWIPAVVVPAVVIAGAVIIPAAANASPELPAKTPEQLLEFVAASANTVYSGTLDQTSNLGLPQLPSIGGRSSAGGSTSASVLDLFTAPHTVRVFVGAAHQARAQVMDSLAERDVIVNGTDVWTWDSKANTANHLSIPADALAKRSVPSPTTELAKTPAELAQQLLDGIEPSTAVSVTNTARVAGRPVYQLVLTPKSGSTLVGSVIIAVDSETGLPLGVEVNADGQTAPAFSVEFSSIDFAAPDASTFAFTPPAGATVKEQSVPSTDGSATTRPKDATGTKPTVTGTGWSTIIQLPAGSFDAQAAVADGGGTSKLLDQLLTPVSGGMALETSIVSVLLTTDGRVFVGAVSTDQLLAAAAQ